MANKTTVRTVKGTRDYYPEDMAVRVWLYEKMRAVSESFGYQEYEGPILETLDLYAAKSGEEIVKKQSYVFEDRSGELITLRPELTPTLARMVAQRQGQLMYPLRWWSFGPFWRYERPQKGRTREFFQWNIDMIGDDSPGSDAELISIAASFLRELGFSADEVQIKVNCRALMDSEVAKLGFSQTEKQQVFHWIDRKDKFSAENWLNYGLQLGFGTAQLEAIQQLIANKNLWQHSESLSEIFEILNAYGIRDYVSYDPSIIRGLQYYTGTVFEAWDTAGEFRALFGGGRYDNLVGDVGGQAVGGVGFACGDLVIRLLLEKLERLPNFTLSPAEIYVTVFDEARFSESLQLAKNLRQQGFKVTCHQKVEKLGKQFKFADRIGAKLALVLGPDEVEQKVINVKNLITGDQKSVSQSALVSEIKNFLVANPPS